MRLHWCRSLAIMGCVVVASVPGLSHAQSVAPLPRGVKAVWNLDKAYRETTPTRERICINGLWRWQPAASRTTASAIVALTAR